MAAKYRGDQAVPPTSRRAVWTERKLCGRSVEDWDVRYPRGTRPEECGMVAEYVDELKWSLTVRECELHSNQSLDHNSLSQSV